MEPKMYTEFKTYLLEGKFPPNSDKYGRYTIKRRAGYVCIVDDDLYYVKGKGVYKETRCKVISSAAEADAVFQSLHCSAVGTSVKSRQGMPFLKDTTGRGCQKTLKNGQVKDFLWPRWGLDRGKKLLELLQSEPLMSRPLLIHAFSIGGYTFAQLLVHISRDKQKYEAVTNRIKGQVYDSLVVGSLEHMATGLGKTIFPRWESLIKQASMLYFSIFKRQTVDYFNAGIDAFYNTPVQAPALVFFCENDLLSDAPSVEKLMDYWQKRGMDITAKKWEVSTHAGHLPRHPQEYLSTLEMFLHSLQIAPLKAKM